VPGDQLRIEVTVVNWRSRMVKMKGVCTVDGKVAADATITCQLVDRVRKPKVEAGVNKDASEGAAAE
jgi:3-hydroxyacyl-[acyl-carrier-protein] dehydratase